MLSTLTIRSNTKTNARLICKYMRGFCIELDDVPGKNTGFTTKALANHNLCEKFIYFDKRNKRLIINDVTYTIIDERTGSRIHNTVSLDDAEFKMKKLTEKCYSDEVDITKNKESLSNSKMIYPYNLVHNVTHYEVDILPKYIAVCEYITYIDGEFMVDRYSTKFDPHSNSITVFGRTSAREHVSSKIPDVYKCGFKMLSSILYRMT